MTATSDLIQKLYIGYFGRAGDPSGLQYWVERKTAGMGDAAIAQSFSVQTEATNMYGYLAAPSLGMGQDAFLESVYQNLFERSIEAGGLTYWKGQLNAGRPVGSIILDIINGAQGSDATTVANKLSVANYYTEKVISSNATWTLADDQADAISVIANVTSADSTVTTGKALADTLIAADTATPPQSFTLTTGTDTGSAFTGGSGADTFSAPLSSSVQTLTGLDSLNGGNGSDTLSAVLNSGSVVIPSALTSIETITVSSTAAGSGLSLLNATGVTTAEIASSTASGSITGISSTTVGLKATSNSADVTFTFANSAVSGSADTVTVTANGQSGAVTVNSDGSGGVETINIVSTGGVNNITNLSVTGSTGTSTATKLVATGASTLTLGTAATAGADAVELASSIKTIDLTGLTGTSTIFVDATAPTVTGGSGNDTINLNAAGDASVVGGAGNDRFNFYDYATGTGAAATSTYTSADTIDGGDGSADVLASTAASLVVATTQTKVSNIERLLTLDALAAAADLNATYFGSAVNYVTVAGTAGAGTITSNAGDATVNFSAATGGATTFVSNGTGTADSVTVVSGLTSGATALAAASAVTATGVETLTIGGATSAATTVASVTMTGTGGTATKFAVTGANSFTVTAATEAKTIDASGLTMGSTSTGLVMGSAASTNTAQTIIGSGGVDTLIGTSGADSITAGAGNDAITSGAGNDTIIAGDGDDTITFGASFATGDSVDGGAGTDTISITTAGISTLNNYSISVANALNDRVSNIERVLIADANTASLDLARVDSVNYVRLEAANTGGAVFSGFGASGTVNLRAATNDADVTLTDASGSADIFNVITTAAADTDFGTLTVGTSTAVVETVNVTANEATADSTIRVHTVALDGAGTKTVVLAGTESITSTVSSTALASIDASALSAGAANITATASLAAITAIGSNQNDTFSTGSGADSVSGGLGDDSLIGGSGNDTLDGGVGNDTVVAGVGVDSLVGGDGTDTLSLTGWTIGTTTDGGSTAVLGLAVNLGTSSVTAATINALANLGDGTNGDVNADITALTSGQVVRLGAAATVSSRVSTYSGIENVVGSSGGDYITGSSSANTITGGDGTDYMTGGSGADTFVFTYGDNAGADGAAVADIIVDFLAGTDKLQFANIVDVVSGQQAAVQAAVTALVGATNAQIATAMAANNTTNLGVSFATYGGDTYVYLEKTGATATHVEADNIFIKLVGVTTVPTFAADVVA